MFHVLPELCAVLHLYGVSSCICVCSPLLHAFDLCHPILFFLTDCQILKWASLDGLDAGVSNNNDLETFVFPEKITMTKSKKNTQTHTRTPNVLSCKCHQFNIFTNRYDIQLNYETAAMLTCVHHVIEGHAFFSFLHITESGLLL